MRRSKQTKVGEQFKGNLKGSAHRGSLVAFGDYALKATDRTRMTAREIEAAHAVSGVLAMLAVNAIHQGRREAARTFLEVGTPVAAICGATFGLAREGLLDDRAHTSGAAEYLTSSGYAGGHLYQDAAAVTDRNLITAGPTAPVEFAREIFTTLGIYQPEVLEAWYRLFGDQDASAYWDLANADAR